VREEERNCERICGGATTQWVRRLVGECAPCLEVTLFRLVVVVAAGAAAAAAASAIALVATAIVVAVCSSVVIAAGTAAAAAAAWIEGRRDQKSIWCGSVGAPAWCVLCWGVEGVVIAGTCRLQCRGYFEAIRDRRVLRPRRRAAPF
jgi:hypothetical protein